MKSDLRAPLLTYDGKRDHRNFFVFSIFVFFLFISLILTFGRFFDVVPGEDLQSRRSFFEVPLAVTGEEIQQYFPEAMKLCQEGTEVEFTDISPPVRIKFLQPISAGQSGAILKVQAGPEKIAFKLFHGVQERNEVAVMRILVGQGMQQCPELKLGGVTHQFVVTQDSKDVQFKGYGMELIPFLTLFDFMAAQSVGKTLPQRIELIFSPPMKQLFDHCIQAMQKMWTIGVIHRDLHANNIFVDPESKRIKIIDFGRAEIPDKTQELKFKLGMRSDYMRFGLGFVSTLLFAEAFASSSDEPSSSENRQAKRILQQLDPDIAIPFTQADFPERPDYKAIFDAFRQRHGITGPPAQVKYMLAKPPPESREGPPSMFTPNEVRRPLEPGEGSSTAMLPNSPHIGSGSSGSLESINLTPLDIKSSGKRDEFERSGEENTQEDHVAGTEDACTPSACEGIIRSLLTITERCTAYCSQLMSNFKASSPHASNLESGSDIVFNQIH